MTESAWKVAMGRDGLKISGETFELTMSDSDPGSLDTVVSGLQAVARRTYGQYCPLSRAIEAVGERWSLLIVRDLLVDAKSASELYQGMPRVPRNLLSMRLKEMAYSGIIEKDETTDVDGNPRYRLTKYGLELEDVVLAYSKWGAAMLTEPRPEDIVTEDSMMMAMRGTFQPEAAAGRSERFELHFGDIVIHVVIEDGLLEVGRGPLAGAPEIHPGPELKKLLTRQISVPEALATGNVKITGDPGALDTFISMFAMSYRPAPEPSAI